MGAKKTIRLIPNGQHNGSNSQQTKAICNPSVLSASATSKAMAWIATQDWGLIGIEWPPTKVMNGHAICWACATVMELA